MTFWNDGLRAQAPLQHKTIHQILQTAVSVSYTFNSVPYKWNIASFMWHIRNIRPPTWASNFYFIIDSKYISGHHLCYRFVLLPLSSNIELYTSWVDEWYSLISSRSPISRNVQLKYSKLIFDNFGRFCVTYHSDWIRQSKVWVSSKRNVTV